MTIELDPQRAQVSGRRPRRVRTGRRFMLHRLSVLVLLVCAGASFAGGSVASSLVDRHQHDLLLKEADEVSVLFEQLGSGYGASIASVAAIANVTDGDPTHFAAAVEEAELGGAWTALRNTEAGLRAIVAVGESTVDINNPPAEWRDGIERAGDGEFRVLGLTGAGMERYLGLASGAGDTLLYVEIPLFAAAAQSVADDDDEEGATAAGGFLELDFAAYVGSELNAESLLFQTSEPGPDAVQHTVDIGGNEVTLVIDSAVPLGGSLIDNWPLVILALGGAVTVGLVSIIELIQRRRDDAVRELHSLASQNVALDTALRDRQAAEETSAALETELRQMQRLESVGQLAGGVAHDFNNLLAAILSYADLLGDDLGEQGREDLDEIRLAARRGADLTRRLLQFSRQSDEDVAVVDVGALITELSRLLERTIGEDVELRTELCADDCRVLADARSLEQVVLNLVINARDAAGPGGAITVATACVELDEAETVSLPGMQPGPHVRLTVSDDGSGMSEDVVRRAFDPFFTTKGRAQGTGLGLATVYGTVQGFHGHVGIASEPGIGTTVTVLMPRVGAMAAPATVEEDTAPSAAHAGRVLVVEDEPAVRAAMRRMLERSGFEVLEACDGHQAVAEHADTELDLVVTDIVMPGTLNGADVAEQLRATHDHLPVLFVTGYGADILGERGITVDGTTSVVLHKPFSERELLASVDQILEGVLH